MWQSGSDSVLKVEIDDPEINGIEFLVHDEAQNKWFVLSNSGSMFILVQFLLEICKLLHLNFMNRFKNNGENFRVLFSRQNNDVSVVSSSESLGAETSHVDVPEELVQIQSYLRWERNGKQMYTPEQEKASFLFIFYFTII